MSYFKTLIFVLLASPAFAVIVKSFPTSVKVRAPVSADSSPLAVLAKSMAKGSWAPLSTNNISETLLNTDGAAGNALGYTDDIAYDPVTKRLFYYGSDHNSLAIFLMYDMVTNTWSKLPRASWMPAPSAYNNGMMHAYDHTAIDPDARYLYHRSVNGFLVHRYNIDSKVWDTLPTRPTNGNFGGYGNCCDALEYFQGLGGLVWVAGDGVTNQMNGHAYLYKNNTWSVINGSLNLSGTWQSVEYNRVHDAAIFYSASSNSWYKLDNAGITSTIAKPSFAGYDGSGYVLVLTADPFHVDGRFIALAPTNRNMYTYNLTTDKWEPLASNNKPNIANRQIVVAGIPEYGVASYTACDARNSCQMYLYKY